jgi:hypothetical protein
MRRAAGLEAVTTLRIVFMAKGGQKKKWVWFSAAIGPSTFWILNNFISVSCNE